MNAAIAKLVLGAVRERFAVPANFIDAALRKSGDLETEVWLGANITDAGVVAELKALGLLMPNAKLALDGEVDAWPIVQRHFTAGQWERTTTGAGLLAPATPFDMLLG